MEPCDLLAAHQTASVCRRAAPLPQRLDWRFHNSHRAARDVFATLCTQEEEDGIDLMEEEGKPGGKKADIVNIEFEFFDPTEEDFHYVKTLLMQGTVATLPGMPRVRAASAEPPPAPKTLAAEARRAFRRAQRTARARYRRSRASCATPAAP